MNKSFLIMVFVLFSAGLVSADDKATERAIEKIASQEKKSVAEVKKALETGCASGNTAAMTECGRYHFMIADIELNDIYEQLKKQLKTQSAQKTLKKAQRAWITFRDAVCEFESDGWSGGSGYGMVYVACMDGYTKERTMKLREYLACTDPDCPGIK